MCTRSSSNLPVESSPNPTTSNPNRRNHRHSKQPFILEESPVDTMADQRNMAELQRAPTKFFGLEKDNTHDHIHWFNKITSTIKYKDMPNSVIKLMFFPFSLTGAAHRWLKKEPRCSILTWEDLVSKFINEFFPPRTTNLYNEILNFQQRFDESFHEACDRYKDLLRACPHHGFTELHQLDTFYNALNLADQDSLNSAADGNLLERRTQDVLMIIENKSKVRNSRNKSIVSQVKSSDANSSSSFEIAKLTYAVNQQTSAVTTAMTAILKQFQATLPPAFVKDVEEIYVTCGGAHPYYQCLAAVATLSRNIKIIFKDTLQQPQLITIREDERVEETLTDQDLAEYTIKKMLKALLSNKEKLLELENTPFNENCSAVILKKLPKKLGDPGKFLILCGFSELKCKALANLSPLILGRPFLRTARALIDVHGEEMILRDEVKDDIFDSKGGNVLIEKLLDLDSTKDLHPPHNVNPLSSSTTSFSPNHLLEEFTDELALITFPPGNDDLPFDIESDLKELEDLLNNNPIKEIDSILEDSVDEDNLADLNDNLADTMPEVLTNEHTLDYSSPPLYDEYDDDIFKDESDTEYVFNDPFDFKGEKIKESKLLIDELDLPKSSDFLPSFEYDLFLFADFSKVDALPSTDNEDKVFNPVLEDFDPPLYELPFHKEVPGNSWILKTCAKDFVLQSSLPQL
nr:reverse transcriptase domain-containing protein [Tanacetum cinerariifolium]